MANSSSQNGIRVTIHNTDPRRHVRVLSMTDPDGFTMNFVTYQTPSTAEILRAVQFLTGDLFDDDMFEQELKIQSHRWTGNTEEKCVICFEEYKPNDMVTSLKCSHVFHTNCLEEWGKRKSSCPTCRDNIPIQHGFGNLEL